MINVTSPIELLDLRDRLIAEHVLDLQKHSYQVEADLIGFDGIPPLHDTLESIRACQEIFCGLRVGADLAGVIAYERHEEAIEICRMMVHPGYFRQGIASRLLRFVEDAHADVRVFRVSTGSRNLPAVRLYQREGFVALEERPVAPGVFVTLFEKRGR